MHTAIRVIIVALSIIAILELVLYIQSSRKSITLEHVATHATKDDCWMVIQGNVYNVTAYIASRKHPGGGEILKGCGVDATKLFDTRPSGSRTPHSADAQEELQQYYIGTLSE